MHLTTRNVNSAFKELVKFFDDGANDRKETFFRGINPVVRETSRNGSVLRINEPIIITYTHPRERVLFNQARDANPTALLYESLYMLAGRNDVSPLVFYTKQFKEYSDDGKTLNGAYGYRWRSVRTPGEVIETYGDERDGGGITGPGTQVNRTLQRVDVDQLNIIVEHLKTNPNSRRAVLSMWNVEDDLLQIGGGTCLQCHGGKQIRRNKETGEIHGRLSYNDEIVPCPRCKGTGKDPGSKDVCCNTQVMFSIREDPDKRHGYGTPDTGWFQPKFLDITVTNRSNDLIWGALGANYTTFSVLQEYMAARLGVSVGRYYQFTNNLHVYTDGLSGFKPQEWLADKTPDYYSDPNLSQSPPEGIAVTEYWGKDFKPHPLVHDPAVFEEEVKSFVEHFKGGTPPEELAENWDEPFLSDVAQPMMIAYACYKVNDFHGAFACVAGIEAPDWRLACEAWLHRRYEQRKAKGLVK